MNTNQFNPILLQAFIDLKKQGSYGFDVSKNSCEYQTIDMKHCIAGLMIKHKDPTIDLTNVKGGIRFVISHPTGVAENAISRIFRDDGAGMMAVAQDIHDTAASDFKPMKMAQGLLKACTPRVPVRDFPEAGDWYEKIADIIRYVFADELL